MKNFKIESNAGVELGTYEAETPEAAIRAMNADAGESDLDRDDGLIVREVKAAMGRPLMGSERRQLISITIDPATLAAIETDMRPGESRGQVIDRWALDRCEHLCDICAAGRVRTPATWESTGKIEGWLGLAGAHVARVCDCCRAELPEESDDPSELAQADLEPLKPDYSGDR